MAVRGLSFGGTRVRISNGSPPEGSAPSEGGMKISEGRPDFGSVPFAMIFEQIVTVIAFGGLLIAEGAGIFLIIKKTKRNKKPQKLHSKK